MTDMAQVTGASSSITLQGTTYQLAPLTLADLGLIVQWIKDDIIGSAARACQQIDDPDVRQVTMQTAFAASREVALIVNKDGHQIISPEVEAVMMSPSGTIRLLHTSLVRNHPNITTQQVSQLFKSPQDFASALQQLLTTSGIMKVDNNPAASGGAAPTSSKSEETKAG